MTRSYKSPPGTKTRPKYNPVDIARATRDVMKGMSFRKASLKYGIPTTVLHRRITKPNTGAIGHPVALGEDLELAIVANLITCGTWGYPMTSTDLKLIIKGYLDRKGARHRIFKDNLPGKDWVNSFLKRHKDQLAQRMCQNIKRARASVNRETINDFFDNLETTLNEVQPSNIVNYDETNLTDDPGRKKIIVKRGTKYPERVINSSKSSTSIMYAGAADGKLLAPYIVYKAVNLYDTWTVGGPRGARYNRSKSGWFDMDCFTDWFQKIALPYLKKLEGKKVIIGDNLSSHLSAEVITACEKNNIEFVFLPANSTHLTQPLDVAFFRPLKIGWRDILLKWKLGPGKSQLSVAKEAFPNLLKELDEKIMHTGGDNLKAGFKKCGIHPLDRAKVLARLPGEETNARLEADLPAVSETVTSYLKQLRYDAAQPRQRKKKLVVAPGKSVKAADLEQADSSDAEDETGDAGEEEENAQEGENGEEEDDEDEEDEDEEEEDEEEDEEEVSQEEMETEDENGAKIPSGCELVGKGKLETGKWVVVDFGGTSKKKKKLYVGKVIRSIGKNSYEGIFLRETFRGTGSTFSFPVKEDRTCFDLHQVHYSVKCPEELRRGIFKFEFNIHEL